MKKNKTIKLNFREFGKGKVSPVAYDTAWLARVPHFPNINKPAFPKALAWLRKNQLTNGSWGNNQPFYAHGNILSTLAALLALSQWKQPQDKKRIKKGLLVLRFLAKHLHKESPSVGFELLFPALIHECQEYGLQLPASIKKLSKTYIKKARKKAQFIKKFHQKYGYNKPASWWFSLEMWGGDLLKNTHKKFPFNESTLFPHGSIAASPSATAYFLAANRWRGKDVPKAFKYLQTAFDFQKGTQHVFPIDEFELSFSANYLLDAEVSPSDKQLQYLVKGVKKHWQQRRNDGLGYSSDFFVDPDDTAVGFRVLTLAGQKNLQIKKLLKFFNGNCIENFAGENSPAISANLHTLHALQTLPQTKKIKTITKKLLSWLENQQINKAYFLDKWHSSPIYPTTRAIIALQNLHEPMAQRCVNWLIKQQHANGGWGMHGFATAEETALASLALCSWQNYKKTLDPNILKKAHDYLQNPKNISYERLWTGKVLYCPKLVTTTMIVAAQHALNTTQNKLLNIANLKSSKYINVVTKHTQGWAARFNLINENDQLFKSDFVKCACSSLGKTTQENLKIFTDFGLIVLFIDDSLDENWQLFSKKFEPLCAALNNLQNRLIQKKLNTKYFHLALQQWFKSLTKELQYKVQNKNLSLPEYFKVRTTAGGMDVANELAFALKKLKLSEKLRNTAVLQQLKNSAYQALIIANDILSFDKEIKHGDINNYLLIKQRELHCSLQDAFRQGIQDYNKYISEFLTIKNQLLRNSRPNRETKTLAKIIEIIASQTQAHLNWAVLTPRYFDAF